MTTFELLANRVGDRDHLLCRRMMSDVVDHFRTAIDVGALMGKRIGETTVQKFLQASH